MEKKYITAIQRIRSMSKQRVTSQRISQFTNRGALISNVNSFKVV